MAKDIPENATRLDVAIVGAGVAGLYAIYRLRKSGLQIRAYEAGDGVGGTWFWNRYPGCRCDVESMEYSYSFDDDVQQEWKWPERYGTQPEILRYVNHVAERVDLSPGTYIVFSGTAELERQTRIDLLVHSTLAGIGVLFLLGLPGAIGERRTDEVHSGHSYLSHHLIPQVVGTLVIPFILLFALYVQFHGEYGPGGGFQAGAIFAAGMILYSLIAGEREALQIISPKILVLMMAGGALLYGSVGVVTMLMGGNFLEYGVLLDDPVSGQQWGILAIEMGVGITVTGVLLAVYHAFAARGS